MRLVTRKPASFVRMRKAEKQAHIGRLIYAVVVRNAHKTEKKTGH